MQTGWNIRGNFFGGVTAAVIALPLGLAFGVASGLGAAAGIYGAIILGFFAALFSGTPTQISGPTGPMTVVVAASVVTLQGEVTLIAATVFLAGIMQIIFGLMRVGRYIRYIPYPVISGFMSGIGIIIILLQINPFLGLPSQASVVQILIELPSKLALVNLNAVYVAAATLGIMFFTPNRITRYLPAPLIALLLLTPITYVLQLPLATIGAIPASLPDFIIPSLSIEHYTMILSIAFTLAVLGMIDTLLTSLVADSITHTKHNPNRELVGQGIGNTLCAFAGAIPGAGATMRTVINIKSGGTHRLSGMIHALTLLLIVLFFAPLAAHIPLAVLAGILIKVGVDILDYRFIAVWRQAPKHDLLVMLSVFFITVFIDLITAVGVGIVLASLLIVYRITKETQITLDQPDKHIKNYDLDNKKIRIIKINGAFFFGSSTVFESKVNALLDTKTLIIDILDVPFIDLTAIFTLKDLILKLQNEGIEVAMALKETHKQTLLKLNVTQIFDAVRFYESVDRAVAES